MSDRRKLSYAEMVFLLGLLFKWGKDLDIMDLPEKRKEEIRALIAEKEKSFPERPDIVDATIDTTHLRIGPTYKVGEDEKRSIDMTGLAVELVEMGLESPLDDLLDSYQWEAEAGLPHDPRVEKLLIKLLSESKVRAVLFSKEPVDKKRGRPKDSQKDDRDFDCACDVVLWLNYKKENKLKPEKEEAYRQVAKKYGVRASTVRDAYAKYKEAAHHIHPPVK